MRLGIVSDTHGHLENTRRAVRMLESLTVDQVIHCGDIGAVEIIPLFSEWPTHFVFGNVDYNTGALRETILEQQSSCHERFGEIELEGRKIAFLHGDDSKKFIAAADSGQYDMICYGHSHVASQETREGTILLNPGALYRANRHTIATVELPSLETYHVEV